MRIKVTENPIASFLKGEISQFSLLSKFLQRELSYTFFEDIYNYLSEQESLSYDDISYELTQIKAFMDPDPTNLGLNSLNLRLQQVQAQKDRLATILVRLYSEKSRWEKFRFVVEKFFEKNKRDLLSDKSIESLRNQQLQIAAVERRLPLIVKARDLCDLHLVELNSLIKQSEVVFNNMKSINDNISRQITVIQQQIAINEIQRR